MGPKVSIGAAAQGVGMFTARFSFEAMGRLLKGQQWALTSVIVAGLTFYPLAASWAQSDPRIVAANPLLARVSRLDPALLASILSKLEPLESGTQQGPTRGPKPTPAELAQIKENPDFALACDHHPEAALGILRSVNKILNSQK